MDKKTVYSIFCETKQGGSAIFSSTVKGRPQTLEGMIEVAESYDDRSFIPVAWAAEATDVHGGTKTTVELKRESIAAGRTVEYREVDQKYMPQGVGLTLEEKLNAKAVSSREHPSFAMCTCGKSWGSHDGALCPSGTRTFVLARPATELHAEAGTVKRVRRITREDNQKAAQETVLLESGGQVLVSSHPADIAMIRKDGPVKPKTIKFTCVDCVGCEKCGAPPSKIKPTPAGFGRNSWFFTT